MAFGMPDVADVVAQIAASAAATERLAVAIDRLAAATEKSNALAQPAYLAPSIIGGI